MLAQGDETDVPLFLSLPAELTKYVAANARPAMWKRSTIARIRLVRDFMSSAKILAFNSMELTWASAFQLRPVGEVDRERETPASELGAKEDPAGADGFLK